MPLILDRRNPGVGGPYAPGRLRDCYERLLQAQSRESVRPSMTVVEWFGLLKKVARVKRLLLRRGEMMAARDASSRGESK